MFSKFKMKQCKSVAAAIPKEDKKEFKQVWTGEGGKINLEIKQAKKGEKGKKVIKLETPHVHCELKIGKGNFLLSSISCHSTSEMLKGV